MRELERLATERALPQIVVSDNGTELTRGAVLRWRILRFPLFQNGNLSELKQSYRPTGCRPAPRRSSVWGSALRLQCAIVTERGVLGDRAYALVDRLIGNVGSTKNEAVRSLTSRN